MIPRNTPAVIPDSLEDLRARLDRAEDRAAAHARDLRWILRELRFANIRLPITEQQRIEELQIRLGAW
jgi:hypothetical protein